MLSEQSHPFVVYGIRLVLYISDTIFTTSMMTIALTLTSALSLVILWLGNVFEVSILLILPILGMAVYLAQKDIASDNNSADKAESLEERIIVNTFMVLYFNFLFVFSVVIAALTAQAITESLDLLIVLAFAYPILDFEFVEKVGISPAALPVAIFVIAFHQVGRATWFSLQNLDIRRIPILELWFERRRPRMQM